MRRLLTLLPFLLLAACPAPAPVEPRVTTGDYPEPPENHVVDEGEGTTAAALSPCGRACEHLRIIECSDGYPARGVTCYRACLSMASQQRVPTKCWSEAATVAAARKCGGLRCLER